MWYFFLRIVGLVIVSLCAQNSIVYLCTGHFTGKHLHTNVLSPESELIFKGTETWDAEELYMISGFRFKTKKVEKQSTPSITSDPFDTHGIVKIIISRAKEIQVRDKNKSTQPREKQKSKRGIGEEKCIKNYQADNVSKPPARPVLVDNMTLDSRKFYTLPSLQTVAGTNLIVPPSSSVIRHEPKRKLAPTYKSWMRKIKGNSRITTLTLYYHTYDK